jgi:hypothetical protein
VKRTATVLLVIALTTTTVCAEDKLFWTLAVGTQVATIFDLQTTRSVFRRCPSCSEANPIMKPFVPSPPAAVGVAVSLSGVSVYGSYQLKKKGIRWWWVPLAIPMAAHTAAGLNNRRIR